MTPRLIVAGCGAFARELINWADDAAHAGIGQRITGFLDANPAALAGFPYRAEWLGDIDAYTPEDGDELIVAIGDPNAKRDVVERLRARGARFGSLRHPSAVVARSASLGAGVVLCPHAVVSADAQIGDFVAVNVLSSIGHDVKVGAYSMLSSHVDLMGHVETGERVFFGSGAKILPKVRIGAGAKIGAGATVMRSAPENAVLYTMPAKKL
ncbi:acetyltransferase [Burkholderia pseudomallei]|uniref:acetyltransferase n=1 Tax=Burkholderia pseudomallei TaxID=28450 RepID=UPI0021F6E6C1|nr:acetyltransferase [Burkholderia pseudomallei]MCV9981021.1 acetyltransferase [Burkholderia pseudomallei]MCV9987215.1 acetyltransferase [Burkholderia pseudomallei]MCW0009939.1 acetyltransferase [Burkholderia pseudomallei]MCW0030103.1 acetyltransferase [Burkholderia pseudomallei]MCW0060450.1 acetyltransferase [Burkholderia pseudomallei]